MIEAIAAGRRAALSIDTYIGGDGTLELEKRNAECRMRKRSILR